jgi:predicted DsbA family dithiol-disulfide isomerase
VSPPLRVPVLYDFSSLICYVGHRTMQRMSTDLAELEIELVWSPIDLTWITGWRRGAAMEGPGRANALRVASDLDVAARVPPVWMDSRDAAAVALALAGTPAEVSWRERVFSAVYEEGRSLDEPGFLEAVGGDVGVRVSQHCTDEQRDALDDATEQARQSEVSGVPTFMLDGWPFGGIQEAATMRALLGRWAAKKRREAVS